MAPIEVLVQSDDLFCINLNAVHRTLIGEDLKGQKIEINTDQAGKIVSELIRYKNQVNSKDYWHDLIAGIVYDRLPFLGSTSLTIIVNALVEKALANAVILAEHIREGLIQKQYEQSVIDELNLIIAVAVSEGRFNQNAPVTTVRSVLKIFLATRAKGSTLQNNSTTVLNDIEAARLAAVFS